MIRKIDQHRVQIGIFGLVVFLFWMSYSLYAPTLPNYIKDRTNDLALTGTILSMYGLFGMFVRLPLGIAADWLGRGKYLFFVGIIFEGLGAWLLGSAKDADMLIAGEALIGLASTSWVLIYPTFSKLFPPQETVKATIIITIFPSLGRLLGSLFTGPLNDFGGYSLTFFVSVGISGLALLFLIPFREVKFPAKLPSMISFTRLFTRRDVMSSSFLNLIGQYVVMGAVFGFIPILAQHLGAGNIILGILVTEYVILYALSNLANPTINRRLGSRTMVTVGILLISLGFGIAAIAPWLSWLFIAQACFGIAGGISYPVIVGMCIEKVPTNERHTAMGLHQTIYSLGAFVGPWLSGILSDAIGLQPMFGVSAFACLASGLLGVLWLPSRKNT